MPAGKKAGFIGSLEIIIEGTVKFAELGGVQYDAAQEDPADVAAIVILTPAIAELQIHVPAHNTRWS